MPRISSGVGQGCRCHPLHAYLDPLTASTAVPPLGQIAEDLGAIVEPRCRQAEEAQFRADMFGAVHNQLGNIQNAFIGSLKEQGVPVHSSRGDFVARHAVEIRGFRGSAAGGGGATFGNEAERPATVSVPSGFYLISGLGTIDMGNNLIRICAGHVFARRGQHYGPTQVNSYGHWFDHEDVIIGTDAVSSAMNKLAEELQAKTARILSCAGRQAQRVRLEI